MRGSACQTAGREPRSHGLAEGSAGFWNTTGVQPVAVDKQQGHSAHDSPETLQLLRVVAGSRTGRRNYLDVGSELFDPVRSAAAVRRLLDEAVSGVVQGRSLLVVPLLAPPARDAS